MASDTMQSVVASLLDWIYPPVCFACETSIDDSSQKVCQTCLEQITKIVKPICPTCGAPIAEESPNQKTCGNCPKEKLHFDMARSFLNYEDARVRNLIRAFKFECISSLDEILNPLMAEGFEHFFKNKPIDHMIPVPLHKSRKKEREFNQAELLCRGIEESCSIKAATDVVVRNRMTVPQVKMSPQKRKANLHGAFTIKIPDRIHGKRILLVDDVFTTGSTVNEISLTLKQAGAKMVMVYTLARAGLF